MCYLLKQNAFQRALACESKLLPALAFTAVSIGGGWPVVAELGEGDRSPPIWCNHPHLGSQGLPGTRLNSQQQNLIGGMGHISSLVLPVF